jgi:5-(carboxyamino)imidazole ribonucleotide synthase
MQHKPDAIQHSPILPGATLGLLGGGQLGRYFVIAARTAGYEVWVLDPDPYAPAAHFASRHLCAAYDDPDALKELGNHCAAVTTEFENTPASAMAQLADHYDCAVRPSAQAVSIAQDRIREKQFFQLCDLPVGHYSVIRSPADIPAALSSLSFPAIIKTARFGYDGKGQVRVANSEEALTVLQNNLDLIPCVIEQQLDLATEISVVLGRSESGEIQCFPVSENQHKDGILDISILPARVNHQIAEQAREMAKIVAHKLDYVGVMAVEFFLLKDGNILLNEMAPRPHNSGHATIDAGTCSQFEQQVRLVCGFAPESPAPVPAAVMVNILGDSWGEDGVSPAWEYLLSNPQTRLHLYGKREPRKGRKMGHFTVLGTDQNQVIGVALSLRAALQGH